MIVLDSSFLIAFHNTRDAHHESAAGMMARFLDGEWGRGLLLEYVDDGNDVPWRDELLCDPPVFEAGYLRLPAKPGLGSKLFCFTVTGPLGSGQAPVIVQQLTV